uniref:Peptidase S1 domain-containing protein n=1 Tax=Meloidogyne enterolobii TaxID=390850 RepID=A0A6V7WH53_MELEN|nr:unnamed protein product [Meloidogyne enterolobii]
MFSSTFVAPKEWSMDNSTNTPFYYDAHRCGMPIKIDNHGYVRREKRFRPPHLRHHRRHFNKTREHVHRKMMGGYEVDEGDLPWAVTIHLIYEAHKAICSGTLISRRHVITAAHCFVKPGTEQEEAGRCISYSHNAIPEEEVGKYRTTYIGSICTKANNTMGECKSNRQQRRFNIKKAKYSHYFDAECHLGDFALLELEEDVPASIANHICLLNLHPTTRLIDWHSDSRPVVAYGWGTDPTLCTGRGLTEEELYNCFKQAQAQLHLLVLPGIWRDHECRTTLEREAPEWQKEISERKDIFCTMEKNEGSVCSGDSGGGLIGQFEDASFGGGKRWFLLGIVSFGIPCDSAHLGYMEPGAQASLI